LTFRAGQAGDWSKSDADHERQNRESLAVRKAKTEKSWQVAENAANPTSVITYMLKTNCSGNRKNAMVLKKPRRFSEPSKKAATDRPQRTAAAPGGIYQAASRQSLTGDLWADGSHSQRIN
jgi:hypothetical protein